LLSDSTDDLETSCARDCLIEIECVMERKYSKQSTNDSKSIDGSYDR